MIAFSAGIDKDLAGLGDGEVQFEVIEEQWYGPFRK